MNLRNALFRFRYWVKPNTSRQIDKKLFVAWLHTLPATHRFDMHRQDPLSQFLRCTTRITHVSVGLDWYSFENPALGLPLRECHALPKWASSVMWDKSLGSDFTKAALLERQPELLSV